MKFPKQLLASLQGRILFLATITLALFSGLTGLVLQQAYSYSLEEEAKERLQAHIYTLLAVADIENGKLALPTYLQEDRFNQLNSDLMGVVSDHQGETLWHSVSALNVEIDFPKQLSQGEKAFLPLSASAGMPLFVFSMGVVWEMMDGGDQTFTFSILESKRTYFAKLEAFKSTLYIRLLGGSVLLLLLQFMILKWGLAPIKKMATGIRQIESGEAESLEGRYPKELELVARNLNVLVANERRQRQRYRDTMGDLAHSLKTPLAVMNNAVVQSTQLRELQSLASEQLDRMDQIVQHQLQRAVTAMPASVVKGCLLIEVVKPLLSALQKVYLDKGVEQVADLPETLQFFGDKADLMEMLGNILDNAHKHCRQRVELKAALVTCEDLQEAGLNKIDPEQIGSEHSKVDQKALKQRELEQRELEQRKPQQQAQRWLKIDIADDGEGVPEARRTSILQRGVRGDSRLSGQGIGLAVAAEICTSYQGNIEVGVSGMGGAQFTLLFPMPH